ncbi:putative ribonuclease H-like domain-containing protein [Tanacetum coccineum]
MNKLVRGNLIRGLPSKIFENDHSCVACQKGKQYKDSCKAKLVNSIRKPLHMLHMDLFGPTNVKSLMKKSYCLVVIDDFSRFYWVFFLATKDETSEILKTFITEIENQLDYKVKVIKSDNGTEFKNSNGVAERRNRTLIEAARTMLVDSKLATTFWAEAANTVCYVLNMVLVIKPHNKTPYKLILGRTPLIDFMKPFGCPVIILNTKDHLGKFDRKADEGFFVGYSMVMLRKRQPEQEYILIPFCTTDPLISQGPKDSEEDVGMKPTEVNESGASDKGEEDEQDTRSEFERLLQQEKQTNSTNSFNTVGTPVSAAGPSFTNDDPSSPVNAAEASNAFEDHLFERFSPFKNAFALPHVPNVFSIDDTRIFGNAYDDEDVGAEADLNNLETTMNVSPIPTTRIDKDHPKDQIIGDLNLAIQTRRMTKISNEHAMVWTLVDLPNGKRAIGTKWVFRNKKDERGIVVRNKARLVIKMDVKSAFLYGTIEEEVYVCQPPSFEDLHFPDKVYKVEKALYGLHQAPRAWYETLSTYLIENGLRRGTIDKTLFIKKNKGDILLVQKEDGIFISQDKYVAKILKNFDFATVKTVSTPIETNKALVKDEEAEAVDVHLYRSMIGSLMYLIASRPDIMFAVCACARDSPFNLDAFSDSDYVGASLDRKSTTRGCQFLIKRLISLKCKKQTIVSNSTTEAEYVVAANYYGQVLWIQNQMLDYRFNFMNTKIYIDNESTICIVKNLMFHSKTKHIEIRHHFIKDSYE